MGVARCCAGNKCDDRENKNRHLSGTDAERCGLSFSGCCLYEVTSSCSCGGRCVAGATKFDKRQNTTHVVNQRCTQDETCSHRQLDRHAVQSLGISVPNTLKKKQTPTSAQVAAQSQDRDGHEKTKTRRSKTSTRRDSASRCMTTICWINEVNAVTVAADIDRANAAGGEGRKERKGEHHNAVQLLLSEKKDLYAAVGKPLSGDSTLKQRWMLVRLESLLIDFVS